MWEGEESGLPILDVPPAYASFGLGDAVLHWISDVVHYDQHWVAGHCVGILTDECFYVCTQHSKVTHCIPAASMLELVTADPPSGPPLLGIRVFQEMEYDILVGIMAGPAARDQLARMLQQLHQFHTRGDAGQLPVVSAQLQVGGPLDGVLNLGTPPGWRLLIEPIKSRRALASERARRAQLRQRHEGETAADIVADGELRRISDGLRLQLQHDYGQDARRPGRSRNAGAQSDGLQQELAQTREQLRRCKEALQEALRHQAEEIDCIREQFLAYDREIVAYLNRVYAAFPSARPALGAPPCMPQRLQTDLTRQSSRLTAAAHDAGLPDPQGLAEDNARLRERLRELEAQQRGQLSSPQPGQRMPAAEARRPASSPRRWGSPPSSGSPVRTSGAVGGGMGPGGRGSMARSF